MSVQIRDLRCGSKVERNIITVSSIIAVSISPVGQHQPVLTGTMGLGVGFEGPREQCGLNPNPLDTVSQHPWRQALGGRGGRDRRDECGCQLLQPSRLDICDEADEW